MDTQKISFLWNVGCKKKIGNVCWPVVEVELGKLDVEDDVDDVPLAVVHSNVGLHRLNFVATAVAIEVVLDLNKTVDN